MLIIDNIINNPIIEKIIGFYNDDDIVFFFIKILGTLFIIIYLYVKFLHDKIVYKIKKSVNGKKLDELGENNVYYKSQDIFENIEALKKQVNKELNPEERINDISITLNKIYVKLKEINDRRQTLDNEYSYRKKVIEETYNSLLSEYNLLLNYHKHLQYQIEQKTGIGEIKQRI